jgi:8-oxo-dGTP pyrophosphatase MutT (NUDIX family)
MRECKEETGVDVTAVRLLLQTAFHYEHDDVQLDFWLCELQSSSESKTLTSPWQWIPRNQLAFLNFPPANAELIEQLTAGIDSLDEQTSKGQLD